jgi:hypothetical protein
VVVGLEVIGAVALALVATIVLILRFGKRNR